jgi:hypothetical protein
VCAINYVFIAIVHDTHGKSEATYGYFFQSFGHVRMLYIITFILAMCVSLHYTVVYHDARMKKKIPIFFPKTGHFEHIIRHDIKIFGKKNIFSSQNLGFKSLI